jgi:excisionase family DNA binding protein
VNARAVGRGLRECSTGRDQAPSSARTREGESSLRPRETGMSASAESDSKRRFVGTREAAAVLGVHERTVRRYIASGALAHRRLPGGHYRIAREAIEALLVHGPSGATRRRSGSRALGDSIAQPAPRPWARRARSARERADGAAVFYDLSPETLRALRARTEPRRG